MIDFKKFSIEEHKKKYINYCEVVIDPEGTIHYAEPSHTGFLERYGAWVRGEEVTDFIDMCPPSMYGDYLTWLLDMTGCVSCWSCGYLYTRCNDKQKQALQELIDKNLVEDKQVSYGGFL